ncbi:hypothetical protein, partial [Paraburkholderia sp. RL17-373-BIF-A]|uniref:hypothetical protein n=1 Tax=Paraburkholderia sp. RL17-373-BIF-A TaxID=3031629 RepID=UPI0038BCE2B8
FGREQDSPVALRVLVVALRVLAVALLNHADELDPDAGGFSKNELTEYRQKLLGRETASPARRYSPARYKTSSVHR